jgi:zeaxanthin glucosyltransferase
VYPSNSVYDNMGNSTRVLYHKLGLRGNLQRDTENEISDKIEELINNETFKKNIEILRHKDSLYTSNIAEIFTPLKSL